MAATKSGKGEGRPQKDPPPRTPNLRFGRFLQLGGSKWTEIMLYEQGVPLRRSGHLTCLYSARNKIWPEMGRQNWRNWGQIAHLGPLRLKWRPNMSKWVHVTSQPCGPPSWTNQWQLGPNQAPQGCPRPSGAPKRDFMGQCGPFCGPQECCRGLLRVPSTWSGCGPPSWTNQWHLGPNQAPQGCPRPSGTPKRAFLGQNGPFRGP